MIYFLFNCILFIYQSSVSILVAAYTFGVTVPICSYNEFLAGAGNCQISLVDLHASSFFQMPSFDYDVYLRIVLFIVFSLIIFGYEVLLSLFFSLYIRQLINRRVYVYLKLTLKNIFSKLENIYKIWFVNCTSHDKLSLYIYLLTGLYFFSSLYFIINGGFLHLICIVLGIILQTLFSSLLLLDGIMVTFLIVKKTDIETDIHGFNNCIDLLVFFTLGLVGSFLFFSCSWVGFCYLTYGKSYGFIIIICYLFLFKLAVIYKN